MWRSIKTIPRPHEFYHTETAAPVLKFLDPPQSTVYKEPVCSRSTWEINGSNTTANCMSRFFWRCAKELMKMLPEDSCTTSWYFSNKADRRRLANEWWKGFWGDNWQRNSTSLTLTNRVLGCLDKTNYSSHILFWHILAWRSWHIGFEVMTHTTKFFYPSMFLQKWPSPKLDMILNK